MAPKKKKMIRKKSTISMPPFNYNPPNVYELGVKPHLFVKCKICCTALPHLNFEWPAVPTDLTLSAIKEAIVKRHGGSLPHLTLFKGVVHPENSLARFSDATTLKDLGCEGVFIGPDVILPTITFYYDFVVACFDDPIGAVEPDTLPSKHDISLKLYRKLTSAQAQSLVQRQLAAPAPVIPVAIGAIGRAQK
ncbi:hypothetical protein VOLCADRAFT_103419 [Volvox carteri f. nagariensis]|uniref:Uncharacterized protein n=1 Tax=Volvox carteri f. nagariensis TaxID=3068 RepID=D8TLR4_VOLCA|nr:uncharacterized protein VOLCADRAFT_103419 [Volvox carteri f. nagariensis]EFJ51376.1 hypothetical protein VOLCADRAFT_103419 [Volvox carteri f. nagariensis]|eukprot:XP_002947328.1 hypothetical protein VOLCADRAFT_103419 [Volvox carteri f. nagariensis]